jgi:hypothetical protein
MSVAVATFCMGLTMRLSDAGLRCRTTKLIYPHHRLPSSAYRRCARARSNRLLDADVAKATIHNQNHDGQCG